MSKKLGKVKFFDGRKGFGFLRLEDGGRDVFLGERTLRACGIDKVREGDSLLFEVVEEEGRSPRAESISKA